MVRKGKPSAEHEREWAEDLVKLAGGPPDSPSDSFHGSLSPEMQAYRKRMEARQVLPDDSVLPLDDYLAMERVIDDSARRQVLQVLVSDGDLDVPAFAAALDLEADDVHDHLDELVGIGLVQFRQRDDPDRLGVDSYYRASTLGEGILEHGVLELMRRERDFLEAYG
jgi:predicted transcriptional regulator